MDSINLIESTYRRLVLEGKKVLKLYSGNPNEQGFCFPPEVLQEAYGRYFEKQFYAPHPKGSPRARESIRDYYLQQGVQTDCNHILLSSGTSESFFYLFTSLAAPGDNFLTPVPAYPLFDHLAKAARIELKHYLLEEGQGWRINLDSIWSGCDARTRGIVLISPNNPTGAVHRPEEIQAVVEGANRRGIPLICDEVFSEFYFGEGRFPRLIDVSKPNLAFTLNGISKMFALPALKLSWILVTGEKSRVEPAVDRLETLADSFLSCHTPIQEALPEIFSAGGDFVRSYVEEVGRRRCLAMDLLGSSAELQVVEPRGGFYLTAKVVKDLRLSEEEFVIRLLEKKGVFVHPGYFYDYEAGIHFIISFLTRPEKLQKGLESILSFL